MAADQAQETSWVDGRSSEGALTTTEAMSVPMQASALRAERAGRDRLSANSTPVTAAVAQAATEHSIVITAGTDSSCCTCNAETTYPHSSAWSAFLGGDDKTGVQIVEFAAEVG